MRTEAATSGRLALAPALVLGVLAAIFPGEPVGGLPGIALGSELIWRAEVGLICAGAAYVVSFGAVLAFHGVLIIDVFERRQRRE